MAIGYMIKEEFKGQWSLYTKDAVGWFKHSEHKSEAEALIHKDRLVRESRWTPAPPTFYDQYGVQEPDF